MRRNLSFPKAKKLTRTAEFDRVREEGRKFRGSFLTLGVLPGAGAGKMRAGFITSRRTGGAVVRNRLRRRLREIVRHHQHAIADRTWLVIIASPHAGRASYAELEAEWLRLAKRASILAP